MRILIFLRTQEAIEYVWLAYRIAAGFLVVMAMLYVFLPKTVKYMKSRASLRKSLITNIFFPIQILYFAQMQSSSFNLPRNSSYHLVEDEYESNYQNFVIGWVFLLVISRGVNLFRKDL